MANRKEIEKEILGTILAAGLQPIDIRGRVNTAVTRIAAGIRLMDGRTTPPLPDLLSSATVATDTSAAYAALDSTYQRNLFMVSDENNDVIPPPSGGNYYSFQTFMRRARYPDLSETGSIYMCCARGANLYYQGIPSSSENLLTRFYRKPVDMPDDDSTPDGIPDPYAMDLLKHFVCRDVFGEHAGDELKAQTGDKMLRKFEYHNVQLEKTLVEMVEFIGEEGEPIYYRSTEWDI